MYTTRIPFLVRLLFPQAITHIKTSEKVIYLTFDDGPVPEITPWVLEQLNIFNVKATFFCIGDNVQKHSDLYKKVLENGHSVGNHTYNHLNGWNTGLNDYMANTSQCSKLVNSNLFRPPYGRMRLSQYRALKKQYNVIMWDVLSGDFDTNTSPDTCFNNIIKNTKKGSIVVFHDSIKASFNLKATLPKVLAYYSEKGYVFEALPMQSS